MSRSIKQKEFIFVQALLALSQKDYLIPEQIIELDDGKMGSIQFASTISSQFENLIEVEYIDSDNVLVLISLRAHEGKLTELDFWKTDFSQLKKYPTIDNVKMAKI